mmetsp:Transcript_23293/g.37487  ORF Transcript_23293/g.37487 Transcript_23293/m.37487 type:complete len:478 (+) Transcript_23293:31-1464(+)
MQGGYYAPRAPAVSPSIPMLPMNPIPRQIIEVKFPKDKALRRRIDLVAQYVAQNGYAFERALKEQKKNDKEYAFLFQKSSNPEWHMFYRWRSFSLANGDSLDAYRTIPFQMVVGGPQWVPPRDEGSDDDHDDVDGGRSKACRKRKRRGGGSGHRRVREKWTQMSKTHAEDLYIMLRNIKLCRTSIMEVMGFILEHSNDARDISEILLEALTLRRSNMEKRMARLYLLSDVFYNDVLYNTSPLDESFSVYRDAMKEKLQPIFKSFASAMQKIESLEAQHEVFNRVIRVLGSWQAWNLFPDEMLDEFSKYFLEEGVSIFEVDEFIEAKRYAKAVLTGDETENNPAAAAACGEGDQLLEGGGGGESTSHAVDDPATKINSLLGDYKSDDDDEPNDSAAGDMETANHKINTSGSTVKPHGKETAEPNTRGNIFAGDGRIKTNKSSSYYYKGVLSDSRTTPAAAPLSSAKVYADNLAALEDL